MNDETMLRDVTLFVLQNRRREYATNRTQPPLKFERRAARMATKWVTDATRESSGEQGGREGRFAGDQNQNSFNSAIVRSFSHCRLVEPIRIESNILDCRL